MVLMLIEPINLTKCPRKAHQSQHKQGLIDLTNLGKDVGKMVRALTIFVGSKQLSRHEVATLAKDCRSPFSVVAALVPLASKMAKRSRHSTHEVSKFEGASSKSTPEGKSAIALDAVRHQKSSSLISA